MYLLVFVFLMMSIIGLYTELYALQISHMFAKQKGVAEVMQKWHGGAYLFARTTAAVRNDPAAGTIDGCLLTDTTGIPALSAPGSCAATLANNNVNFLPAGYQNRYKWYSIVYAPGGAFGSQRYIITYAPPSTAGDFTSLIAHPSMGFSPSELLRQIRNSDLTKTSYGIVKGGRLLLPDAPFTAANPRPEYPVPETSGIRTIPEASIALISPL